MKTHLVIGASGLVGGHLMKAAPKAGVRALGTYRGNPVDGMEWADIREPKHLHALLDRLRPAVIHLAAAASNVDYCQLHPEETYATNVMGVKNVVDGANAVGAKIVYFSTDFVFDGKAGPYGEEDTANPICEYGRQKFMAEHHIALHACDYLIVRTTVVYGWERQGKNFIYRLVNTLKAGDVLKAPVDQVGSPTYAPNLAEAALELAAADRRGVFHVVGPDRANRYEFACEAAKAFGLNPGLVQPVSTADLNQAAPRPLNAGMLCDKAAAALHVRLIGYRDGLRAMAAEGERR